MTGRGYFGGCTGYTWAYGGHQFVHQGASGHPSWSLPGGTGSIYPSEYGVHSYDQYSGVTGWQNLSVYSKDYVIDDIELSDTFESWRVKTNTEIIEKLNQLHVYGATPGDGMMMALGTGGTLAVAFSGNVLRTHSTFCNNISVGGQLRVAGALIGVDAIDGGIQDGHNFDENLLILNTNESPLIGCNYAGLVIGGSGTGPDPDSIANSPGFDGYNDFVVDRPYLLHKDGKWRTKEALWFEGNLNHQDVYSGATLGGGTTGDDWPHAPYGYTGCSADLNNPVDWASGTDGQTAAVNGGVVRMYFGPTMDRFNYLDFDGRGNKVGATGDPWTGTGGFGYGADRAVAEEALVIGNVSGPLIEFERTGSVNIVKGANNMRITKASHGFVFGNVIRYSGTTQGYTYASAAGDNNLAGDHIQAAEVIGVVSRVINEHTFDLSMSGEISGTKAEWNTALIENDTEGLVPGNVYFLSQYERADIGKLQREAPHVVGYVNKPVLVATSNTSGVILPYRGQMNSSTGCTAGDGAGKSGGELTTFLRAYDSSVQSFAEGQAVCVRTMETSGIGLADATDISRSHVIGIITYVDATNNYLRIATSGTVTLSRGILSETGTHYLSDNGRLTTSPTNQMSVKVLDALSPTRVVLNIDTPSLSNFDDIGLPITSFRSRTPKLGKYLNIKGPTGATGHTYDNATRVNKNELLNGNFQYWQRGIGTTSSHGGTANTYFADRWLRLGQFATGDTNPDTGKTGGTKFEVDYKLARGKFDKKETTIQGHPDYYAIVRGGATYHAGINHQNTPGSTQSHCWHRVEQRIPDATSFAGEVMTISFFAKGNNPGNYHCTGGCHVAFLQNLTGTTGDTPGATANGHNHQSNTGVTASEINTPIADFHVNKFWTPYNFSFFVPELSNAAGASGANHTIGSGASGDHFVSLAFYTQNTDIGITFNYDLHLSQVKLERGNIPTAFNTVDHSEELRKCERYYQNSYVEGVPVGADTMHTRTVPDMSGINMVVANSYTHIHPFAIPMRKNPTCSLWSPQGIANEAYNRDASNTLGNVAGTHGFDGRARTTRANAQNITCKTDVPAAIEIKVLGGAVPLDTITVHYEADAEFNNAFPTPIKCH